VADLITHIVIGHDESGEVHIYQFASAHEAGEFIRLSDNLTDIGWEQYWVIPSSISEAVNSVKRLEKL